LQHVNFTWLSSTMLDIQPVRTAATRWLDERMDYDLGVWILCNQANRAREEQDVSAETFDEQDNVSAETSEA